MSQKKIERKALITSIIINAIMAIAGIVVFVITKLQALFLDAFFSFIGFTSSIMAFTFSKVSKKKTSSYPTGMYFLEPFYGVLKAIFIFILLISSLTQSAVAAFNYTAHGIGTRINLLPILPYTVIMLGLSLFLYYYNRHQNKKINNISTMLTAESKSNLVDAVISGGIGVLIIFLLLINPNSKLGFFHYTGDFFITSFLVLATVREPIILLSNSVRELSGATVKDKNIKTTIRKIIAKQIRDEELHNKFEVYKIGMHIKVVILLNENIDKEILHRLKTESLKEIKEQFDSVTIEYVFRK